MTDRGAAKYPMPRTARRNALLLTVSGGIALFAVPPPLEAGFALYLAAFALLTALAVTVVPIRSWISAQDAAALLSATFVIVVAASSAGARAADATWLAGVAASVLGTALIGTVRAPLLRRRFHAAERHPVEREAGYLGFLFVALLTLVYAGWLARTDGTRGVGGDLVETVVALFVAAGLGLIRLRFTDLQAAEGRADAPRGRDELDSFASGIWTELFAWGLGGFVCLAGLLAAGADPLGLDPRSVSQPPHTVPVVVLLSLAPLLALIGYLTSRQAVSWSTVRTRTLPADLAGLARSTPWLIAALITLILGPLVLLERGGSYLNEAAIASIVLGVYAAENVFAGAAWLQLARLNWGAALLVVLVPGAVLGPLLWLLQTGLLAEGKPVNTEAAIPLTLLTLTSVGATLTLVTAGLAWRVPRLRRAWHPPGLVAAADQFLIGLFALVGAVLPVYVAARASAGEAATLGTKVVAVGGLIAFVGAMIINWFKHPGRERRAFEQWVEHQCESGKPPDDHMIEHELDRLHRVEFRIRHWQVPVPLLLVIASLAWLLIKINAV